MQPRFLRDPEMSMLCSLVDIVPAGSTADHVAMWSKDAISAFASMIGDRAILLTVCGPHGWTVMDEDRMRTVGSFLLLATCFELPLVCPHCWLADRKDARCIQIDTSYPPNALCGPGAIPLIPSLPHLLLYLLVSFTFPFLTRLIYFLAFNNNNNNNNNNKDICIAP